jgi:hypothetical protein
VATEMISFCVCIKRDLQAVLYAEPTHSKNGLREEGDNQTYMLLHKVDARIQIDEHVQEVIASNKPTSTRSI